MTTSENALIIGTSRPRYNIPDQITALHAKLEKRTFDLLFVNAMRAVRDLLLAPGWICADMGGPNAPYSIEEAAQAVVATVHGKGLSVSLFSWNADRPCAVLHRPDDRCAGRTIAS